MTANEVIEYYVRDVASCLPRAKRDDVAFELRALLDDELAARAEAEARAPDKEMAMALLKGFGRPAEAARRYHERPALIDPADSHHFIIWGIAGAVAVSVLSALSRGQMVDGDLFLQWLGMLVLFFALMGWWRRRAPDAFSWTPKRGPEEMPRWAALVAMAATLAFPFFMYAAPGTFVETIFRGRLSTGGLELTEAFQDSWQRTAAIVALATLAATYAAVAVQGGWRAWTWWINVNAHLGLGLLLVAHAAPMAAFAGGPHFTVFESALSNRVAAPIFGLVGAMLVLVALYDGYREWARIRPAPALREASA